MSAACDSFQSETGLLIEACLKSVREAAHLDDDPILPPLPLSAARRDVVVLTQSDVIPSASAIVATAAKVDATPATKAKGKAYPRWPLFLCAFIASAAASASILASPIGQRPAVQRVTQEVRVEGLALVSALTSALADATD
ncbi:MAG: hypothetical protein KF819_24005 [Labilithrix sp.]|nr:hypothetical protein [Labilithrix sp.]